MEDLLLALLLLLGMGIARGFRLLRDRLSGPRGGPAPSHAGPARRAQLPGATEVPRAAETPGAAQVPGRAGDGRAARDEAAQRAALDDRLAAFDAHLGSASLPLASDPELEWLGDVLSKRLRARVRAAQEQLAGRSAEELGQQEAAGRGAASRLTQVAAEAARLEQAAASLEQLAAARSGASRTLLQAADRMAAALAEMVEQTFALGRGSAAERSLGRPVSRIGSPEPSDETLLALGVLVIPIPPDASRDTAAWSPLARGIGRGLLARLPALRAELHSRLGLPRRYAVPYLFDGFWTDELVYAPFGPWLETLFADAVSICLLGPGGAYALAEHLARPEAPAQTVTVEVGPGWGDYTGRPPAYLRLLGASAALQILGFADHAAALVDRWWAIHGQPRALVVPFRMLGWLEAPMAAFAEHAVNVVSALASTPWDALGGRPLTALAPEPTENEAIFSLATRLREAPESQAEQGDRPRARLAAALLAGAAAPEARPALARWLREQAALRRERPERAKPARKRQRRGALAASPLAASAELLRDALVLHELLAPPRALRPRTRRPALP